MSAAPASFYYDLGSPYAYLSAERIHAVFEEAGAQPPVWKPVLLGGLFARFDRGSWARTDAREQGMREVERRAQAYGLPPIRWPDRWPADYLFAMRVATFATEIGRGVSLPLAAFRQHFAAGRDLSDPRQRPDCRRIGRASPASAQHRREAGQHQAATARDDG